VIARLRNKAPLAVEHKYGDGRVVAFLTKASPLETSLGSWNNWARGNPSFVVAMLELQSYLAASRQPDTARLVGVPLAVPVDEKQFNSQVRFVLPRELGGISLSVDAAKPGQKPGDSQKAATATPGATKPAGATDAVLNETDASGIYEARLTRLDGTELVERFALNVAPEEGDLKKLSSEAIAARLEGIRYEYHEAGDINYNPQQLAGFNLSESLLFLLVAILLAEQALAYACSYHPRAREGRA
jgi:hypothetical protein